MGEIEVQLSVYITFYYAIVTKQTKEVEEL